MDLDLGELPDIFQNVLSKTKTQNLKIKKPNLALSLNNFDFSFLNSPDTPDTPTSIFSLNMKIVFSVFLGCLAGQCCRETTSTTTAAATRRLRLRLVDYDCDCDCDSSTTIS